MRSPGRVPPNAPGGAGAASAAPAQPSWPERYRARLAAALRFLEGCGFWIERVEREPTPATLTRWRISGVRAPMIDAELIAFAEFYGFDGGGND
jgi:hypothetical protein